MNHKGDRTETMGKSPYREKFWRNLYLCIFVGWTIFEWNIKRHFLRLASYSAPKSATQKTSLSVENFWKNSYLCILYYLYYAENNI